MTEHAAEYDGVTRAIGADDRPGLADALRKADVSWDFFPEPDVAIYTIAAAVREWTHAYDPGTEACRRCGGPNVIWSTSSPLWNYVMRSNDINGESRYRDLVCMPCFIICAIEAGLPEKGWRLTLVPEPEGLIYETPSGRTWDAEKFLWVDLPPRSTDQPCGCSHSIDDHVMTHPESECGLCTCPRYSSGQADPS